MQVFLFLCHGVCLCIADPVPAFSLEVNPVAKSFRVTLDVAEYPVYVKWCYKGPVCIGSNSSKMHSQSEVHNFPFLLPCFCVEVGPPLYNFTSARLLDGLPGLSLSFPGLLQLYRCPSSSKVSVAQFCR